MTPQWPLTPHRIPARIPLKPFAYTSPVLDRRGFDLRVSGFASEHELGEGFAYAGAGEGGVVLEVDSAEGWEEGGGEGEGVVGEGREVDAGDVG